MNLGTIFVQVSMKRPMEKIERFPCGVMQWSSCSPKPLTKQWSIFLPNPKDSQQREIGRKSLGNLPVTVHHLIIKGSGEMSLWQCSPTFTYWVPWKWAKVTVRIETWRRLEIFISRTERGLLISPSLAPPQRRGTRKRAGKVWEAQDTLLSLLLWA